MAQSYVSTSKQQDKNPGWGLGDLILLFDNIHLTQLSWTNLIIPWKCY